MNSQSPILLIGVGGAGVATARGVNRSFGEGLRHLLVDTDAASGRDNEPFILLGGDRLSGHGAGGNVVSARLGAEDSVELLDEALEGVRLAVLVTSLGGGTGTGATLEIVRHLRALGITSAVFATTPFEFEGETRHQNARGIVSMIEDEANASFFLPLDRLVGDEDRMDRALQLAVDTLASGITMFWRLIEKPGYIRMDIERLRLLIAQAGRGRFAVTLTRGPDRARDAVDSLLRSPLLAEGSGAVRTVLCGVLSGEDLRLSEVGRVAQGLHNAFASAPSIELATVNDEATFSGQLAVVTMLFESDRTERESPVTSSAIAPKRSRQKDPLAYGPRGRGRFKNAVATTWNNEDLDVPTYLRRNINLDT